MRGAKLLLLLFILVWGNPTWVHSQEWLSEEAFTEFDQQILAKIYDDLVEKKVPLQALDAFSDDRLQLSSRVIRAKGLSILYPSGGLGDYTGKNLIRKAEDFMATHSNVMSEVKRMGVDPEVVTAILLIETRFGDHRAAFDVFNSLLSLAALRYSDFSVIVAKSIQEPAAKLIKARRKKEGKNVKIANVPDWTLRLKTIGDQWFEELRAFLVLCNALGWDPHSIRGSWAGAFGYAQTIPSTLLRLTQTSEGEVWKVDPWSFKDAPIIVAKHLKENGYFMGASLETKKQAILGYNRSMAYLEQVLRVSEILTPSH